MINRILLTCFFLIYLNSISRAQFTWPAGVVGDLQHTGAVHMYVNAGDLEITLYKRDLKTNTPLDRTNVIYLTGPDGTIHSQEIMPSPPGKWDGGEGPLQQVTLRTKVLYPGVYTLLITSNDDPYLRKNQLWGISTNAERFVLNSGAGHVDGQRSEPISLRGGNKPFSVFFKPQQESFKILLEHLPLAAKDIELRDPNDKVIWKTTTNESKVSSETITHKAEGVWELRLSVSRANILIEGLNYKLKPQNPVVPVWATSRDKYFDLDQVYWLMQPRRVARNVRAGAKGSFSFELFNNTMESAGYTLQAHLPVNFPGKVNLSKNALQIEKGGLADVLISYELQNTIPDGDYSFSISCKNNSTGLQTFSLVKLRVRKQFINKPLQLPLQFEVFQQPQFKYAYEPNYPTENEFYFDKDNNPWTITSSGLKTLIKKQWQTVKVSGYEEKDVKFTGSTIGTDLYGNVYAIAYIAKKPHLIRASANNLMADFVELPYRGVYALGTNTARKDTYHPPAVLNYRRNSDVQPIGKWAVAHDVTLILPELENGKLVLSEGIPVSSNGIGVSLHSGVANTVVSDDQTVHTVWGETIDPKLKAPGVPVHTASYDRASKKLIETSLVGYAPPVNDVHNTSSIIMDYSNQPQIIIGAHNQPFGYSSFDQKTKKWSKSQQIANLDQTYVGAVIDSEGTAHLFYRIWERGDKFPGKFQTALYYQTKPKQGSWSKPRPLALPALPAYSLYKHRATIDRLGNLYLNFEYWSTWTAYRETQITHPLGTKQNQRLSLISRDKGLTWKILLDEDLEK